MGALALRLLPYILSITAAIGGYLYVKHLQEKVTEQEVTLRQREEEVSSLKTQVKDLSTQKQAFVDALADAEAQRSQIRADLSKTLTKLRTQKPPTECRAVVEWAVDSKGDLAW